MKGNTARQQEAIEEESQETQEFDPKAVMAAVTMDPKKQSLIVESFDAMSQLKLERKEINEQLQALRTDLVVKTGVPLEALKLAHKLYEMSDGEVTDVIVGIGICSRATGKNIQLDLLNAVVPQIPELIGRAILNYEAGMKDSIPDGLVEDQDLSAPIKSNIICP
jgi:type III secretory pathway component EscV